MKKTSKIIFVPSPISTTSTRSSRSRGDTVIHSHKKRKIVLHEYVTSDNELTKKETAISPSSQSTIPLSIPTKKTNNKIDELCSKAILVLDVEKYFGVPVSGSKTMIDWRVICGW